MAWETQKIVSEKDEVFLETYGNYEADRIRKKTEINARLVERKIIISDYLQKHLYGNPKYNNKLNKYEYQVYSQGGEDGVIAEIFRRIGVSNSFFVEFGVCDGLECNTTFLLCQGWKGLWMEANEAYTIYINHKFKHLIPETLKIKSVTVNAENVETLFEKAGVPESFDLLSIDVDGNDYWIWQAITRYKPRVVVIEYNSLFPPEIEWVMKYDAGYRWNGGCWVGASLKSLTKLAKRKGYDLVACDFRGVNAFFVQEDLVVNDAGCLFNAFNPDFLYEPSRYFLTTRWGHPRDYGE